MPEDTNFSACLIGRQVTINRNSCALNSLTDSKILMIDRKNLIRVHAFIIKADEVFDDVEQSLLLKIPSKKVVKSAKELDSIFPSFVFHSIKRSSPLVMVPALLVSWSLITQIQL